MNLISVDKISKKMGDKQLFTDISFGLQSGQKTALIGVNGCGKSTLLKILAKKEQPDSGTVSWNRDCRINYLPQMPDFDPEHTVLDAVFNSGSAMTELIKHYESLCSRPENSDRYRGELDRVMNEMNRLDAWNYEYEIKSILGELGINDVSVKLGELSGGMLKKVALAQALIDEGNMLIMDEPTNHLDIETVEWLQTYLKKTVKSILIISGKKGRVRRTAQARGSAPEQHTPKRAEMAETRRKSQKHQTEGPHRTYRRDAGAGRIQRGG